MDLLTYLLTRGRRWRTYISDNSPVVGRNPARVLAHTDTQPASVTGIHQFPGVSAGERHRPGHALPVGHRDDPYCPGNRCRSRPGQPVVIFSARLSPRLQQPTELAAFLRNGHTQRGIMTTTIPHPKSWTFLNFTEQRSLKNMIDGLSRHLSRLTECITDWSSAVSEPVILLVISPMLSTAVLQYFTMLNFSEFFAKKTQNLTTNVWNVSMEIISLKYVNTLGKKLMRWNILGNRNIDIHWRHPVSG